MYQKSILRDYIKDSELRVYNNKVRIRLSKELASKYDQGTYNNYLKKIEKSIELVNSANIKYPSNANPSFYIYIVPDENYNDMLGIPKMFNTGKGGGKPVSSQDLDGFNYAYGTSQNLCQNTPDTISIMNFENTVHEIAHLVHSQFFTKSSLLGEGFAEAFSLYTLGLEEQFDEYIEALNNLKEKDTYTAAELIKQEKENTFGKDALLPNKSCSFRLSYISSYLFVRGLIETIENKYKLTKQEGTQYFLEMIRQGNYTNEWLIFDIADYLGIDKDNLLSSKELQLQTLKNIIENKKRR
ncbi:MAG: hypothetical protein IJL74_00045 [Bacilli bacterium]|nr:hypothetical protein [Bacilli bacterium]